MIRQQIRFECDVCHTEYFEDHQVSMGMVLQRSCLPDGWREVEGSHYCRAHNVIITIKDKDEDYPEPGKDTPNE